MSALDQKADMCSAKGYVRFTPESDIKCDIMECALWSKSGHPVDNSNSDRCPRGSVNS